MSELCSVCRCDMDPADQSVISLECNHRFHSQCIVQSLRYSPRCPMCRDDPLAQQLATYKDHMRQKRSIMKSPTVVTVTTFREQVRRSQKLNRHKIRDEMKQNGEIHRKMTRLRTAKDKLYNQRLWCETRIKAELLKNNIPLHIRKPTWSNRAI